MDEPLPGTPRDRFAGLVHVCLRCEASEHEQGQQTIRKASEPGTGKRRLRAGGPGRRYQLLRLGQEGPQSRRQHGGVGDDRVQALPGVLVSGQDPGDPDDETQVPGQRDGITLPDRAETEPRQPVGVAAQHGGAVLGTAEGSDPRVLVSDPEPMPFSTQARYLARSAVEAILSRHPGCSRKPLWSIRVSTTAATTSAELDDMPEAGGSVESMISRAGHSSPTLRAGGRSPPAGSRPSARREGHPGTNHAVTGALPGCAEPPPRMRCPRGSTCRAPRGPLGPGGTGRHR